MKEIKIFLASSAELLEDRKEFEIFLHRKSDEWQQGKNTRIKLYIWENFVDAISKTRLQDEYNKAIAAADIFVMLFWTKVGMYTEEEFETARAQFLQNGKPLVYTYLKTAAPGTAVQDSLEKFKEKLLNLGHFVTTYKNTEGLLLHFSMQLDKLYMQAGDVNGQVPVEKERIISMINKGQFFEVFEELNKHFLHQDVTLNILEDEFITPSNNFNPAKFATQLKMFVNKIS